MTIVDKIMRINKKNDVPEEEQSSEESELPTDKEVDPSYYTTFKGKIERWYKTSFCGHVTVYTFEKVDDNENFAYKLTIDKVVPLDEDVLSTTVHVTGVPHARCKLRNIEIPDYNAIDDYCAIEGDLFLNTTSLDDLTVKNNDDGKVNIKKFALIGGIIVAVAIGIWIFKGGIV